MHELSKTVSGALIPHTAFQVALRRLKQCFELGENAREPICVGITGESRTGKSRVLEQFILTAKPVRDESGLTVPILRVAAPSKPSIKALASVILKELGDPRWSSSGTEVVKSNRILQLMKECKARVLIIDEFQHFYDRATQKIIYNTCDWLKLMTDESNVVLVVAGLPKCENVIMQNEQLEGRFMAPLRMPRFDWLKPDDREEFCGIVSAYSDLFSAHLELPNLESEEMAFRFYCATGGLIGYVSKLFRELAWGAIDSSSTVVDLADFASAYEAAVWSNAQIDGLRNPFSRDFVAVPSTVAVTDAKRIGEERMPESKPRVRKPSLKSGGGDFNV